MGALDNFFRRFGYAKLDRYGLMLTGDDRVLSTRPAVLDDGLGGKIVGWTDDDLAAMELDHIGVPKAKTLAKPIAAPASFHKLPVAPPAPPKAPPAPMPVAAQIVAPAAKLPGLPPVAVAPVVVPEPPKVADEAPEGEDEWEWTIMMARARAVADEVEQAAAKIATAVTAPKRKTAPGIPAVRAKTEPPVRSIPTPVPPLVERKTIIPVPTLSTAARPSDVRPYDPYKAPRRLPRGTGPVSEDTVRTEAAPANDDRTSPYVTLPPEVKPVGYAHTKRVAAKQR